MKRTLYEFRGCNCCAKAEKFLDELDVEYDTEYVIGDDPRKWESVHELTGQYGVPVLVEEDYEEGTRVIVHGANLIAKYLESEYGPDKNLLERLKWYWVMRKEPDSEVCRRCASITEGTRIEEDIEKAHA